MNLMLCDKCGNRNIMCFNCKSNEHYRESNFSHDKYVKKQAIKEFTQKIMERLKEYEGTYVDVDIVRGIIREEGVIWCRK